MDVREPFAHTPLPHTMLTHLQPPSLLARIAGVALTVVLAIFGFVLMLSALVAGLLLAAGAVVWALLRGRRPGPVNLRWKTARTPGQRAPARGGEVIDIEAREVDETPRR